MEDFSVVTFSRGTRLLLPRLSLAEGFGKFIVGGKMCYDLELIFIQLCLPVSLSSKPVGYAICYFAYSTWVGRSLFLEDLYVQPFYRFKGIGKKLIAKVAGYAREEQASRLELHCLGWNPGAEFYKKLGASDLTVCEDWHYYRFKDEDLDRLAESC